MAEIVVKPETPYTFEQKYVDIKELGTDENCQGKGYGKQLINAVKEYAKQHNIKRVQLNVWTFNEGALKFYDKTGFNTYRKYLRLDV